MSRPAKNVVPPRLMLQTLTFSALKLPLAFWVSGIPLSKFSRSASTRSIAAIIRDSGDPPVGPNTPTAYMLDDGADPITGSTLVVGPAGRTHVGQYLVIAVLSAPPIVNTTFAEIMPATNVPCPLLAALLYPR